MRAIALAILLVGLFFNHHWRVSKNLNTDYLQAGITGVAVALFVCLIGGW